MPLPAIDTLVAHLDEALREAATPERAEREKRYLKSSLRHYGTAVPAVRRTVRAMLEGRTDLDRARVHTLADALWECGVHELRLAAVELLVALRDRLEPPDLRWLETYFREAGTWALVDPLAVQVAGPLTRRDVASGRATLDRWAADEAFWLRRAALLSFLLPLRAGDGAAFEAFTRYADAMIEEREFFIGKAIGWALREYAKRRADEVYAWLLPRAARASTLTLREAAKQLPAERREALLAARARGAAGARRRRV